MEQCGHSMEAAYPGESSTRWVVFLSCLVASLFTLPVFAQDVLTYHNDNARTGQDLNETILTPSNVNSSQFGKLFQLTVDGKVDAQPLYASGVSISGQGTHNVLYVATEHDSVYAFDADTGTQIWQVPLLQAGETTSDNRNCDQVIPEIGITATPVIDRSSGPNGTIYVVAMSKDSSSAYHQRLHALDMTTGSEAFAGPTEVQATFPGTGDNSNGTNVIFDPAQYKERPGLLLLNHVVYTAWSSHCDDAPYTAWIIGYSESTLAQSAVLDLTPNGHEGALWNSGAGMAADSAGNIYALMANGTFDTTLNQNGFPSQGDYGNAVVKISTANGGLAVTDYFTMTNTVAESNADEDLGSGGALLLPDMADANGVTRHLVVGAGKDQTLYLVDGNNMGKFNPTADNIYQEFPSTLPGGIFSTPAYFNGRLYYGPVGYNLIAFQFSNAKLQTPPVSSTSATFAYPGATPSISANGTNNGIVWVAENANPAVLHAFDATDLSKELYNSNQAGTRDQFGAGNKFITPTIANGKVYVGTTNGVGAFALLPVNASGLPSSLSYGGQWVGTTSAAQTVTLANPGPASLTVTAIAASGDFSETNSCIGTLSAGSNCTITVTFKPSAAGSRTGTLSISDNAAGSPQNVALAGQGEDFTLAVASGASASATVTAGQTAQYSLSLNPVGGFNQSVSLTCTGAPAGASCSVNPASATPNGSAASAVMVSVATPAPSYAPRWRWPAPKIPRPGKWWWFTLVALLSILTLLIKPRNGRTRAVTGAYALALIMWWAGCGGTAGSGPGKSSTSSNSSSSSNSYTLTVAGTATAGSASLSHNVTLTLVVQ